MPHGRFRPILVILGAPRRPILVKFGPPSRPILVDSGAPKRSILVNLGPPSRPISAAETPHVSAFITITVHRMSVIVYERELLKTVLQNAASYPPAAVGRPLAAVPYHTNAGLSGMMPRLVAKLFVAICC